MPVFIAFALVIVHVSRARLLKPCRRDPRHRADIQAPMRRRPVIFVTAIRQLTVALEAARRAAAVLVVVLNNYVGSLFFLL